MDPNATINLILNAVNDQNVIAASDHLKDLEEWIAAGGYIPARYYEALDAYNGLATSINHLIESDLF